MLVRSLGLRTDLALHGWRGRVVDHGDHVVVTHPEAPAFRGGNLVVFPQPPAPGDLAHWCASFDRAIGVPPAYPYRAFAWDGVDGAEGDLEPFLAAGFDIERGVVLAAERLRRPPPADLEVRIVTIDDDAGWVAANEVQVSTESGLGRERYQQLVHTVMRLNRRAVEAGHGLWWGALVGDAVVGTLGLFKAGSLARFEAVVTHPSWRGRGVASHLLWHAAEAARAAWGTRLLLLEAEADGPALPLYGRLGFEPIERRVSLGQRR